MTQPRRGRVWWVLILSSFCLVGFWGLRSAEGGKTQAPIRFRVPLNPQPTEPLSRPPPQVVRAAPVPGQRRRLLSGVVVSRPAELRAQAHAHVCIVAASGEGDVLCAMADERGRFSLEAAGCRTDVLVFASAPGHATQGQRIGGSADCQDETLTLVLPDGALEISGSVVDTMGGVVIGAQIRANELGSGGLRAVAVSDDAGRFRLSLPSDEVLNVSARLDGYSPAVETLAVPHTGLVLRLTPASRLRGQVILRTGAALAGARVAVIRDGELGRTGLIVYTDAEGRFVLEDLTSGSYTLVATAAGWRTLPSCVNLGIGEAAFERLIAESAPTLEGFVDLDGTPCLDGNVHLEGPEQLDGPVAPGGTVRFDGLLSGRYQVSVRCSRIAAPARGSGGVRELQAASEDVVVLDRPMVSKHWSLTELQEMNEPTGIGTIRVSVAGVSSGELASAALLQGMGRPRWGHVDGDRIVFTGLELGDYDTYLRLAAAVSRHVTLNQNGQSVDVQLVQPERARISGIVTDERGNSVPDAWVSAVSSRGIWAAGASPPSSVLTDQAGEFALPGFAGLGYDVSASSTLGRSQVVKNVMPGETPVELRMLQSASLSGIVTDSKGSPVDMFVITYQREEGEIVRSEGGLGGEYSLHGLLPGRFHLAVAADGGCAFAEVWLGAGDSLDLPLHMVAQSVDCTSVWQSAPSEPEPLPGQPLP